MKLLLHLSPRFVRRPLRHGLSQPHRALAVAVVSLLLAGIGAASFVSTAPSRASLVSDSALSIAALEREQLVSRSDGSRDDLFGGSAFEPDDSEVIAPPPDTFDAPFSDPAAPLPPAPVTSNASGTGVWALVIGIDDYPGSNGDLRSAVNDAQDMELALDLFGVPRDQRLVLLDRDATSAGIVGGLDWLTSQAGPESTAVVFYAGHVRKIGSGHESIVAADGRMVSDRTVADRLSHLQAERTWVVMASCYGGGFDEVLAPGRILTAAASANRLAYESSKFGRSYLVQYLIRQAWLEGASGPTIQAAFQYSVDELGRSYPNRVPVQFDEVGAPLALGSFEPLRYASESGSKGQPTTQQENSPPSGDPAPSSPPPADREPESPPPPERDPGEKNCVLSGLLINSCG